MYKFFTYTLLFILCTSFVFAREDLAGKSYVVVNSDLSSSLETQTTTDAEVDHIIADLSFFPQKGSSLEIQQLQPKNGGRINGENIQWVWTSLQDNLSFGVRSVLKSYPSLTSITTKTPFPVLSLDPALQQYLVDTPYIDTSHTTIIALASSLAEGETDQFVIVSNLAYWVRQNIKYNLTTLTADASQKASWVLEHKTGVCDELTNLFIALNRALGIPARFISGLSYTNSESFQDPWSPHGWAEVYFPEYGWVPFDPTYGQYGWVDATHIKMKESLDPNEPSTTYQWRGKGITLRPQQLSFVTEIKEIGKDLPPLITMKAEVIKENAGFGSYDLLLVNVKNEQLSYLATELKIGETPELLFRDSPRQLVVLSPREEKKVIWRFQTKKELSPVYRYQVPLLIYTSRNENATTSFEIAEYHAQYTQEEIDESLERLQLEEKKMYSREVDLRCEAWDTKFYEHQNTNITCILQNKGNVYLQNLEVCLEKRCKQSIHLGIGQAKKIIFPITWNTLGDKELEVHIQNKDINKIFSVKIERADFPDFEIKNVHAPQKVKFKDVFTVYFTVSRTSRDPPKDVTIVFSRGGVNKIWEVSELHEQVYAITLYAEDFDALKNVFDITVYFTAPDGEYVEKKASVTVTLDSSTVSLNRRIRMMFNKLVNTIEGWME
ncbi:transglutaminase domain-containing protein [Candidatus Woesearchaeota archaeon]|nr:transglutaminase domain-containing protein [Candidatus Woesearchaeota archaeon]